MVSDCLTIPSERKIPQLDTNQQLRRLLFEEDFGNFLIIISFQGELNTSQLFLIRTTMFVIVLISPYLTRPLFLKFT
jgi:hypothetical protein